MNASREPLTDGQLVSIRELAGLLAWNRVWVDEKSGGEWGDGVLFVIEEGAGRTRSADQLETLCEGIRAQLGHDDFFVEDFEDMEAAEIRRMRQI